jgi:SAM-dependent methyltransferase
MESIFDKRNSNSLIEFLKEYSNLVDIDLAKACDLALSAIKYYRGSVIARDEVRHLQEIEKLWFDSLEIGKPDYDLYNDPYIVSDLWACWVIYSRRTVLSVKPIIETVDSIVDLGCGFGYTTAGLKELYPEADVYATQFKESDQFKIAQKIGFERGFSVFPSIKEIGKEKIDLIFASEYFEHIQNPVEHLTEMLISVKPDFIVTANAFGSKSMGHFNEYLHDGKIISNKAIGRIFSKTLREFGYIKIKTKYWNDRPAFWKISPDLEVSK